MKIIRNIGILAISVIITSCAKDNKDIAQDHLEDYTEYVDSVTQLELNKAMVNWDKIETEYNNNKTELLASTKILEDKTDIESKMDESTLQFEKYKIQVLNPSSSAVDNSISSILLGQNNLDKDMNFTWINKDNILNVYERFVNGVEKNKDTYTREDWDEIKLIYEAIDSRKNTVENEGLTTSDNLKIAALKTKFGPMYKINRIGAKSTENTLAKKQ